LIQNLLFRIWTNPTHFTCKQSKKLQKSMQIKSTQLKSRVRGISTKVSPTLINSARAISFFSKPQQRVHINRPIRRRKHLTSHYAGAKSSPFERDQLAASSADTGIARAPN
jgi:hypothetical protein